MEFGVHYRILEVIWPILFMFGLERMAVGYFLGRERFCSYVRVNRWLHPNAISLYRLPMGFLSILIFHLGYPRWALWFFSFWMITDLTDGDIARRCRLNTPWGETLDPLSDKFMYTPPLVYFSIKGWLNPYAVALFIAADMIGQASRFFIERKAANLFGKAKTFLVVVLLALTMLEHLYGPLPLGPLLNPLLGLCVALAICSTLFKVVPNYWYANILSLMNLVCGLAGIYVIITGEPPIYAFGLVFLGQFLDLFDGRAAERWGSTPKGEIFDDVADGTSFGLTISFIIAISFKDLRFGMALAILHGASTIYRLIRFVVEKRKAGVPGGVKFFSGMPSPAGALLAGSTCLFVQSEVVRASLILMETVLMVSRVPYSHFGRALLPGIPKFAKVMTLAAYLVLLSYAIRNNDYELPLAILFVLSVAYMLSPLFVKRERA